MYFKKLNINFYVLEPFFNTTSSNETIQVVLAKVKQLGVKRVRPALQALVLSSGRRIKYS